MTTMMKSVLTALAIVGVLSIAACDQQQEGATGGTAGTTEQQGTTPPAADQPTEPSGESGTTTTQ